MGCVTSEFSAPESSVVSVNKAELRLSRWFDLSVYRSLLLTNKRNENHGNTLHVLGFFFFFYSSECILTSVICNLT